MALNEARAFEVENGFKVADGPFVTGGAASPVGLNLPTNTLYMQTPTTGGTVFWRKYDTGVNDWIKVMPNDFYQYAADVTETSTTSSTYQTKVSITTPAIPAGDYRIGFAFNNRQTGLASGGNWRVRLDNTTDLFTMSDASNTSTGFHGFPKVTLAAGIHTAAIQWNRTGGTSFINNTYLEFWRVS